MGLETRIWASKLGFEPQGQEVSFEGGGRRRRRRRIVAKALDGQRYPLPLCEYIWVYDGERGSGPEGADDLCFHTGENSPPSSPSPPPSPSTPFKAHILALRLKSQPIGPNPSLEAQILASRLKS